MMSWKPPDLSGARRVVTVGTFIRDSLNTDVVSKPSKGCYPDFYHPFGWKGDELEPAKG
jgi:hypothetical protein